jgi:hypothetical protein
MQKAVAAIAARNACRQDPDGIHEGHLQDVHGQIV